MDVLEDCVAGFTKVFISTPQTIAYLEQIRSEKMLYVVIFLQKVLLFSYFINKSFKMIRGTLARQKCKKQKAVRVIISRFRRYKLRLYIVQVYQILK